MRSFSANEASSEIDRRGALRLISARPLELEFRREVSPIIRLDIPEETSRAVSLAYVIVMSDVATDDESDFPGSSIWLQEWDVWGETSGKIGQSLLRSLRSTHGIEPSVGNEPVMLMMPNELPTTLSLLSLAFLFQWDGYYIPESMQFTAFFSHDGFVDIVGATVNAQRRLFQRFERGGWSPAERGGS